MGHDPARLDGRRNRGQLQQGMLRNPLLLHRPRHEHSQRIRLRRRICSHRSGKSSASCRRTSTRSRTRPTRSMGSRGSRATAATTSFRRPNTSTILAPSTSDLPGSRLRPGRRHHRHRLGLRQRHRRALGDDRLENARRQPTSSRTATTNTASSSRASRPTAPTSSCRRRRPTARSHLFMRVDQSVSYDISRGAGVSFVGMTKDGSTVYFTTGAQLTADDTDQSADLYMWTEEATTDAHLAGQRNGDDDDCHPRLDTTTATRPGHAGSARPDLQQRDQRPGHRRRDGRGKRRRLLLLAGDPRPGTSRRSRTSATSTSTATASRQFVAAFDPGTEITRIQISPTARIAACVTSSRLTGLRQRRLKEMYTYDADNRSIRCASCNPTGQPPPNDVEASSGRPVHDR